MNIPILVAHRGLAAYYPENTLIGIEAALKAGACYIEVDIQLTSDQVPVLLHDMNLHRTTGHNILACNIPHRELCHINASESDRFGDQFKDTPIPALADLITLLQQWPNATAFIEIKDESLVAFDSKTVLQKVMSILKPLESRCIPISYNADAVDYARQLGAPEIGWVMDKWSDQSRLTAEALAPDYLFCNYKKIPETPDSLWPGPWKWAAYEITDAALALSLAARGIDMIESMMVNNLFNDPQLKSRACIEQ